MKYLLLFALIGCIPKYQETVVEPEPSNNKIKKKIWDFCSRICMKSRKILYIECDADYDTMICHCSNGLSATLEDDE